MNAEMTIIDKINEAACIAESIEAISYCISQTEANLEFEDCKYKIFRGIEALSRYLNDELTTICCNLEKNKGAII